MAEGRVGLEFAEGHENIAPQGPGLAPAASSRVNRGR